MQTFLQEKMEFCPRQQQTARGLSNTQHITKNNIVARPLGVLRSLRHRIRADFVEVQGEDEDFTDYRPTNVCAGKKRVNYLSHRKKECEPHVAEENGRWDETRPDCRPTSRTKWTRASNHVREGKERVYYLSFWKKECVRAGKKRVYYLSL
jgi:hypothetical protein